MTMIIHRPRKGGSAAGGLALNDEQRKRAEEHLRRAGYDVDRLPKLVWPDGAVSAFQKHTYAPYQFTYKSDIRRSKIERMNRSLWSKREQDTIEVRYLYVWVFRCPGVFGGIFEGLWAYIVGNGRRYDGGGYKGEVTGDLLTKVKALFPVDNPPSADNREWMALFVKKYRRGKWCGKPQGKAPIRAEVQGCRIRKILGPAKWPSQ